MQLAARNYESITPVQERSVEGFLREKQVAFVDSYLEDGKLAIRFSRVPEQLKARDLISESLSDTYIVALTSAPRTPKVLRALGMRPMNLGLDLRGGLYLLYQVDVEGAVKQVLDRLEQDFRRTLRDERIPYQSVEAGAGGAVTTQNRDPNSVRIVLREASSLEAARAALTKANRDMTFTVDDSTGTPTLVTRLSPQQVKERQDYAIQQNITTLRNRVNELGVSEPIVQRQGLDRINVQLPGVQNSAEVKDILGKTATLEFRLADTSSDPYEAARRGSAPLGTKLYYTQDKRPVLLKRDLIVTGDQLTDAKSHIDPQEGPAVSVRLDARGAAEMLKTTQANLNRPMAVVFIEKVRRYVNRDGQSVPVDTDRGACHQRRDDSRRILQQLPDYGPEDGRSDARWRCCCARARWLRRSTRSRSAPSARASARTTSIAACAPCWSGACCCSRSWRSTTRHSAGSRTWCSPSTSCCWSPCSQCCRRR